MFTKKTVLRFFSILLIVLMMSGTVSASPRNAVTAGTGFTYQGKLSNGGAAVTAQCDFQFGLWDALTAGIQVGVTQTKSNVSVMSGLFTTQLDFGENAFTGDARWLETAVRCPTGSGSYTPLTPRQPLTPAPMALALPGLYTQQNATSPNLIGGYSGNIISAGVVGGVIGGGGQSGSPNSLLANFGTISGGYGNIAGSAATIGGGAFNTASGDVATVGGGLYNDATGAFSTVGGGVYNFASGSRATVPGGSHNEAVGTDSFAAGYFALANNNGSFVWADSSVDQVFSSVYDNQFLIRATGGVGINTTNTTANNLTVNGQIIGGGTGVPVGSAEPFIARGNNSGISLDDRSNILDRWVIYPNNGALRFFNNGDRVSIDSAGILTIGGLGSAGSATLCRNASNQIATCSSSLRYKNNIADLNLGLDTITQLRPVTFDWKESGAHDLGFVAEEVDQVTPLLTTRNVDGQIEGVKYDRISAVLVNAIHEQQSQISDLKSQNAALDKENSALEARVSALEQMSKTTTRNDSNRMPFSWLGFGGLLIAGVFLTQRRRVGV